MGGHFDDDPTVTVVQLLQELDRVDLRDLALLYQRLRQAFHLTCERTFFLGMYRANGVVLQGVLSTSGGGDYVQPFGREPPVATPEPRRLASNDRREAMDVALELWLRADTTPASANGFGTSSPRLPRWSALRQNLPEARVASSRSPSSFARRTCTSSSGS